MRFFTMEWWQGVQGGLTENPLEAYQRHLATLRPFPIPFARLDQLPSLHDAHVRRVEHLGGAVEITLDAWGKRGDWIPTRLSYRGVERFTLQADPNKSLPGPGGFGDLGYDEIDVLSAEVFEHRLLFSISLELSVRFREFNFSALP
jgi:hypothetical protein